jgi:PAS domain S-box-containing protein
VKVTDGRLPILAGVVVLVAIAVLDAAVGGAHIYVSAFLLGPILAALSGRPREVAAVAAAAVVLACLSGFWNDNFEEFEYFFRVCIVLAGSLAAVLAAMAAHRSRLAEAQLEAVLDNLAEAVTVQEPEGRIVYANQAAAAALDAASPEELIATPPSDLVGRFDTFNADGTPIRLEQLPGRQVLAGQEPQPLLVRAINRRTGEERWRLTKASAVRGGDGRVRLAVNIIEDVTESKRVELYQRLLAEASAVLGSSLEYTETLKQVAQMAVPGFADWCAVSMPGDHAPVLDQVAVAHNDTARLEFAETLRERYPPRSDTPGGVGEVLRTGRPQLVTGITQEMLAAVARDEEHLELLTQLGMRSAIMVPMRAGGRTTGAISFVSAESGRTFSEADLEMAMELGRRAGVAVENARLFTERTEVADSLQQGLLPPELPAMGNWSPAAHYQPAGEASAVGGDFYDVFRIDGGWMLVVGDVAGRGPSAATLTALARYTLRTAGVLTGDPQIALASLNRTLRERDRLSLCSACIVVLSESPHGAQADVLCAGHPPPFVVRGESVEQVGRSGPMLGALEVDDWPVETARLDPGDMLVLYTDGVIDARGEDGRFGEAALGEALRGALRPADGIERVRRAVEAFQSGVQRDDMALLAVLRGEPAPALSIRLPDGPDAPRAARRLVDDELTGVLGDRALSDTRLLVSEIVTNAVRHGPGTGHVTLTVALDGPQVRIEVRDTGNGFVPPAPNPDPQLPGGRGLMLVEMLSARWGVADDGGTRVWFEIPRA